MTDEERIERLYILSVKLFESAKLMEAFDMKASNALLLMSDRMKNTLYNLKFTSYEQSEIEDMERELIDG